ncbi:Ca(2+)-dependent cysteine protease [Phlyctochytrium planicorne]|nr:Ca(2+)-dependent cysteine protease [Phlyctochytrium planicorne]
MTAPQLESSINLDPGHASKSICLTCLNLQQAVGGHHGVQQQSQGEVAQNYTHAPAAYNGQGKRRAVFIGINYVGQQGELRGCHQDVRNVRAFVDQRMNNPEQITLMDEPGTPADRLPTKQNIINALNWLVRDAAPGDHFFLHYSGHGGSVADKDNDEDDGKDETIYPLDHASTGQITDDDLHKLVADPLPEGAQLIAIFDSCHSGSVLDLPYSYVLDGNGNVVEVDNRVAAAKAFLKGGMAWMKGDKQNAMSSVMEGVGFAWREITHQNGGAQPAPATGGPGLHGKENAKVTRGVVVQWSGCRDEQTSADAHIEGKASGALSWAFMKALNESQNPSFVDLLRRIRQLLQEGKYQQVPQLSCGNRANMNVPFVL